MKWGKKKSSLISHVFSASWLKKLKLKSSRRDEPGKCKVKQKDVSPCSSSLPGNWKQGRFYSGIDDLYWRLSFGDDEFEEEKSTGGVNSLWYDSDDELGAPLSSCSRPRTRSEDSQRFKLMVPERRKMRTMEYKPGIMQEKNGSKRARKGRAMVDQEPRASNRRAPKGKKADIAEEDALQSAERDTFETIPWRKIQMKDEFQKSRAFKSRRQRSLSCPSYNFRAIREKSLSESAEQEEINTFSDDELSSKTKKSQVMKTKQTMLENTAPRGKSAHVRRGKASRTAIKNECKIRAIEEMKKAKKMKERRVGCKTAFDSYAVVKSSYDPQQDFRDSMVEMIIEKGIKRPEELEELLVCYLNVNCGEYHDLIIKVFRQVWFELNQVYFGRNLHNECSCHH